MNDGDHKPLRPISREERRRREGLRKAMRAAKRLEDLEAFDASCLKLDARYGRYEPDPDEAGGKPEAPVTLYERRLYDLEERIQATIGPAGEIPPVPEGRYRWYARVRSGPTKVRTWSTARYFEPVDDGTYVLRSVRPWCLGHKEYTRKNGRLEPNTRQTIDLYSGDARRGELVYFEYFCDVQDRREPKNRLLKRRCVLLCEVEPLVSSVLQMDEQSVTLVGLRQIAADWGPCVDVNVPVVGAVVRRRFPRGGVTEEEATIARAEVRAARRERRRLLKQAGAPDPWAEPLASLTDERAPGRLYSEEAFAAVGVAEPTNVMRKRLGRILRALGWRATTARDGQRVRSAWRHDGREADDGTCDGS